MISFIVSCYGRTLDLEACVATLRTQGLDTEILICDNDPALRAESFIGTAKIIPTGSRGCSNCYESANMVAQMVSGDWLCFPSHDSLYVQGFSRIMLDAAILQKADLVYCDCCYSVGSENNPQWRRYSVLESQPRMGRIDKTSFIVKRELFKGFPPHPKGWSDGALIEQLVRDGVKHAKAPGVLVVHQ